MKLFDIDIGRFQGYLMDGLNPNNAFENLMNADFQDLSGLTQIKRLTQILQLAADARR
jgi:chemotaxis regulatin CheY-phosphate phosphatase CheZ